MEWQSQSHRSKSVYHPIAGARERERERERDRETIMHEHEIQFYSVVPTTVWVKVNAQPVYPPSRALVDQKVHGTMLGLLVYTGLVTDNLGSQVSIVHVHAMHILMCVQWQHHFHTNIHTHMCIHTHTHTHTDTHTHTHRHTQTVTHTQAHTHYMHMPGSCTAIVTPRPCTRGKAIGLYVCCRCHRCRRPHENRQFGRSRPLSDL